MSLTPLLDGPDLREGAEPAARHLARLGPSLLSGPELIDALDQSDLRGRGGAGFPVGRKWRSVAGRQGPRALIANGAEGEPLSFKDRLLMQARPHLVLDGAVLAAGAVGAEQIVLYIGREHSAAARLSTFWTRVGRPPTPASKGRGGTLMGRATPRLTN